ncbi:protein translocase subunit SecF [Buchananella hordeovulneris]|uniref:protein translocase subunit SecF n=1 Tax=Buchananella hordeovulneris TaxID=52770 RepID=UPI000F5FB421|nr:protein translocase subunit SecF [Buchananella hordeovulneris]RRD53883.1 protein translocase subunit SecF [Buchananella hordeovulneris]
MFSYEQWGNELYRGERTYQIVGNRRWYMGIGLALMTAMALVIAVLGFSLGIEFRGGSQFTVSGASNTSQSAAYDVLGAVGKAEGSRVSNVGQDSLRIQSSTLSDAQTRQVRQELAKAYQVEESQVASSFVGPSWGKEVSAKALQGLIAFLVLVGLVMAVYFRRWTMSVAALFALLHDILITMGVFALTRVEVTPATVIGFLTILGYSLYDTVVVFDKVRENTRGYAGQQQHTYGELVNLAANQTMVRSINTSIVAVLPVASILFLGILLLGSGTLTDIALALFVGMIVGTFSSIFIASPVLVALEEWRRGPVRSHSEAVWRSRGSRQPQPVHATAVPRDDVRPVKRERKRDVTVESEPEDLWGPVRSRPRRDETETAPTPAPAVPGGHRGQAAQPKKRKRRNR